MSDSVQLHRWQPTRLRRSWDSPGKNTEVGSHFLLQCMKVKSESEVAQSCLTLSDPMDCSLPGSSVHGIFQARVLERVAIAFSELKTNSTLFFSHSWRWVALNQCRKYWQARGCSSLGQQDHWMDHKSHIPGQQISILCPHFPVCTAMTWRWPAQKDNGDSQNL